jgi:Cu(I)/Ag(I) efflux system membrane fusion protein
MTSRFGIFAAALGVLASTAAGYVYWNWPTAPAASAKFTMAAGRRTESPLLPRSRVERPSWSATPKNDAKGPRFSPVYDDAEPTFDPPAKPAVAQSARKILFYRNPMGLPLTLRRCRKRNSMGWITSRSMKARQGAGRYNQIKRRAHPAQRAVRTEPARSLVLTQPVRAVGAVAIDERRLTVVSMRSEGYVEDSFRRHDRSEPCAKGASIPRL